MEGNKYRFNVRKTAPVDPELTGSEEMSGSNKTIEELFSKRKQEFEKEALENKKTLLALSREIGVDKQRVYRYIKANNIPVNIINNVIYIDEVVQKQIIEDLRKDFEVVKKHKKSTSRNTLSSTSLKAIQKEMIETIRVLKAELDNKTEQLHVKDRQIELLIQLIGKQNKEASE